jgi:hypothetical protein
VRGACEVPGEEEVSIRELQRIALRLSNQMFVRHFMWLNYPNDPQVMGIMLRDPDVTAGDDMLQKEMLRLGFRWNPELSMYAVERRETSNA